MYAHNAWCNTIHKDDSNYCPMPREKYMNRALRAFCFVVVYLNYIPRYGRLYELQRPIDFDSSIEQKPTWHFMRYGHWGTNLLDSMDLLYRYSEYHEWRTVEETGNVGNLLDVDAPNCGVEHPKYDHQYCVLPEGHENLHEDTEGNTWKGQPDF